MNVLLVGGGGREHALAWKLSQSKRLKKLYIAPGNPGTAQYGENVGHFGYRYCGSGEVRQRRRRGSGGYRTGRPAGDGAVDAFEAAGIKAFGPSGKAAQLEGDKAFSKQIMRANSIPTAESRTFTSFEDAKAYIASRDEPVVVKAAGLAKGKGVFVCDEPSDGIWLPSRLWWAGFSATRAKSWLSRISFWGKKRRFWRLWTAGAFTLWKAPRITSPSATRHGSNTGGMGAYSPAPVVTEKLMDTDCAGDSCADGGRMNRNDTPYKGVLYAG